MHKHIKETHITKAFQKGAFKSRIYRTSRIKESYLLDILVFKDKYTGLQNMALLKAQRPNVYARISSNDGLQR
jgi:hypothetical protein